MITSVHNNLGDFLGNCPRMPRSSSWFHLPASHRLRISLHRVEIHMPSLELGTGSAEARPTMAFDSKRENRRFPLDGFHTSQFPSRHRMILAAFEFVPVSRKQFPSGAEDVLVSEGSVRYGCEQFSEFAK